jgi:hypothetical protein
MLASWAALALLAGVLQGCGGSGGSGSLDLVGPWTGTAPATGETLYKIIGKEADGSLSTRGFHAGKQLSGTLAASADRITGDGDYFPDDATARTANIPASNPVTVTGSTAGDTLTLTTTFTAPDGRIFTSTDRFKRDKAATVPANFSVGALKGDYVAAAENTSNNREMSFSLVDGKGTVQGTDGTKGKITGSFTQVRPGGNDLAVTLTFTPTDTTQPAVTYYGRAYHHPAQNGNPGDLVVMTSTEDETEQFSGLFKKVVLTEIP